MPSTVKEGSALPDQLPTLTVGFKVMLLRYSDSRKEHTGDVHYIVKAIHRDHLSVELITCVNVGKFLDSRYIPYSLGNNKLHT